MYSFTFLYSYFMVSEEVEFCTIKSISSIFSFPLLFSFIILLYFLYYSLIYSYTFNSFFVLRFCFSTFCIHSDGWRNRGFLGLPKH